MKDLIEYFDVPIVMLTGFLVIGGSFFAVGYISDTQKFAAYQKALETIIKCRSSKTGDMDAIFIDKLCGNIPSPVDFGIIQANE